MTTPQTPGSAGAAFRPSTGPGADPLADLDADYGIGEPHEYSTPISGPREVRRVRGSASPVPMVAAGVGQLPRLGEVVRDAERLGAQMLAVLGREVDPASEPDVLAWPGGSDIRVHDLLIAHAVSRVKSALAELAVIADLPLPPVGSAVQLPARQDPAALPPALGIATTGEPVESPGGPPAPGALKPTPAKGEEPSPGSAAAVAPASRESTGAVVAPGAGKSSGVIGPPLCEDGCITECALIDER